MRSTSSPVSRAAAGVYACLAAQVVSLTALAVFEQARGRRLAAQIAAFGGDPASPAARAVSGAATAFAVLVLVLLTATVAAAFAYLSWLRLVRPGTPPAVLAAACLVPGINLVMPPILADLAWRETPAPGRGGPGRARRATGDDDHPAYGRRAASQPGATGVAGTTGVSGLTGATRVSGLTGDGPDDRLRWRATLACWWLSWLAALGLVFAGPARDGLTGLGLPQVAAVTVAAILCAAAVREVTDRHAGVADRGRDRQGATRSPVRLTQTGAPGGTIATADRPVPGLMGSLMDSAAEGAGARRARGDGAARQRPGGGPELPELACQSRRWGSPGGPGSRPSRAAGGAPLSE